MTRQITLRFPFALGDTVQFSCVIRHLQKYRPNWQVEVYCPQGYHSALNGLCAAFPGEPSPPFFNIPWNRNDCNFTDRPSTRITLCLLESFGIPYDPSIGRYSVQLTPSAKQKAADYLRSIGAPQIGPERFQAVLFQGTGCSLPEQKNLSVEQLRPIVERALSAGRVPVIFDLNRRCPLVDQKTVFCPNPHEMWEGNPSDPQIVTALIHHAEAFIGIDSGPGKCASATETPTLICWTHLQPIQYHDPAPNTLHLLPANWRDSLLSGTADYFTANYQHRVYNGDMDLPDQAVRWLEEVLG